MDEIHLWRARGTLGDYICPGGKKRSEINNLVTRLNGYKNEPSPSYPFNCLLLAEPGWGKSLLARRLAEHFNFAHLSFSVAQMGSDQDLKNCLKKIVTAQNTTRSSVLVFIDEIDARIGSHSALGLLLSPIWEGSFMSEGNVHRIAPCVWVFASTKPLSRLRAEAKGRDFLSRINGPVIDLDFFGPKREELESTTDEATRVDRMLSIVMSSEDEGDNKDDEDKENIRSLRTELVYHGVNFLNGMFGPISSVNESVLDVFYRTMPINGMRSMEIFTSRFREISRGQVMIRNVPDRGRYPELERHVKVVGAWPRADGRDVRVIVNPPE